MITMTILNPPVPEKVKVVRVLGRAHNLATGRKEKERKRSILDQKGCRSPRCQDILAAIGTMLQYHTGEATGAKVVFQYPSIRTCTKSNARDSTWASPEDTLML